MINTFLIKWVEPDKIKNNNNKIDDLMFSRAAHAALS